MQHIILSATDKACMDCAREQMKNEWIRKCDWQAFLFPTLLYTRHRISSSSGILFCFVWEVKECLTSPITPFLPLKHLKQWNFYNGKRVVKVRMSVWISVSMRRWGSQPKQHQGNNSMFSPQTPLKMGLSPRWLLRWCKLYLSLWQRIWKREGTCLRNDPSVLLLSWWTSVSLLCDLVLKDVLIVGVVGIFTFKISWPVWYILGKMCESSVNYCECNPCFNGGSCQSGVESYYCHCPFGE